MCVVYNRQQVTLVFLLQPGYDLIAIRLLAQSFQIADLQPKVAQFLLKLY